MMDERLFEHYASSPSLSSTSTISYDSDKESVISRKKVDEKKQKSLYKTELCRNWEETNHCRYGAKCQYAHGIADLREIDRHPKYKTQKCRTFHQTGACPYGSRCTFRHFDLPGDEIKMKQDVKEKPFDILKSPHWLSQETEDDYVLPSAESLLPHQLLFDLESPDEQPRHCPLRLPYQTHQNKSSFFYPWLF